MTYLTILVVVMLDGTIAGNIAYPNLAACEAATGAVGNTLPYDHRMTCQETDIATAVTVRPVARPDRG